MAREIVRYSTGSSLNTYSSLIQSFYSQETAPYPSVHLALNTGTEQEEEPGVKAYIRFESPPKKNFKQGTTL